MKLTFGQKLLVGLFGVQFLAAFMKETVKIKGKNNMLTKNQLDYLTKEIVECQVYQILVHEGKTAKEISQILEIKKITPEKFKILTGKNWPV